jgi:tetratricopeptide (TPR) repeat protein
MESSTATLRHRASMRSLVATLEPALVGLAGLLLASVVAASNGGYFSDSWAWLAFVSLFVATLRVILVPALPLRRLDWAFVAGLGAFAAWVALSSLWAPAVTPSIDETIRDVSYAAVVLALLLVVRRRTVEALLVGALLGVTVISGYTLLTRLHPDWVGNWDPTIMFRLSGPIGYWNGLGLYAAMGVLLALGLVARSESRIVQALAGAAPVFLVPTMLLTFSRGAWLALLVGLAAAILLDARRLQLLAAALVLAPWPAALILLAHQSAHLTKSDITLQQAADEGGSLLVWIIVLAVVSAVAAVGFRLVGARVHVSAPARRAIGVVALAGAALAAVAVFAIAGTPWTLAHRAVDSFNAVPKQTGADVTGRLFDLSSNGRVLQWRVSIDQFRDHRILGDGAGSYAAAWNLLRPNESVIHDSHSLYVEVLGELGIVGLALLVLALGMPLVAAVRARRQPLVTGAFAAYAAFLAHAAVDWDWELAGVTLVALMAAAALIVSARGDDQEVAPRTATRVALPALTAVLALAALAAVLSTVPLSRARAAYNRLDFVEAATQAQKASDWAPWSSEALDILGRSQLAQGKVVKAQASFARAVAKSPNDWELWRDLSAASPPAQARVALRRALELNPREPELKQLQDALAPKKS